MIMNFQPKIGNRTPVAAHTCAHQGKRTGVMEMGGRDGNGRAQLCAATGVRWEGDEDTLLWYDTSER